MKRKQFRFSITGGPSTGTKHTRVKFLFVVLFRFVYVCVSVLLYYFLFSRCFFKNNFGGGGKRKKERKGGVGKAHKIRSHLQV